jgi:DNA-binding NarL/FixJ family response regulator
MAARVHLADDYTMFREGLANIITSHGGDVEVVGQSSTCGEDALALIERNKPDEVITQIDRDLNRSREALSNIRSLSPNLRIIVLTVFDNFHYLKALSKLGIDAYLHKSSLAEDLIATIDALSRERGGAIVVISMPRGMLERLGDEGWAL